MTSYDVLQYHLQCKLSPYLNGSRHSKLYNDFTTSYTCITINSYKSTLIKTWMTQWEIIKYLRKYYLTNRPYMKYWCIIIDFKDKKGYNCGMKP